MGARHPIERNDYLILTRPIERIMASVQMWITLNLPGSMIYGQKRRGKTRCVMFIKKYLSGTLGYPIAVAVLCARRDRAREGDFLDDILDSLGLLSDRRLTKGKKMQRIRNQLLVLARRCPTRKVVYIVDDAQRLNLMNYHVLMSIFNELELQYQVHMFVLLVGQPEVKTKKELFIATGLTEITARMMPDEVEFVGNRSLEEVKFAFNRYDEYCFWPKSSKTSFTRHWAREAVDDYDWSLESEAEPIWNEYISEREARGLTPVEEMPMQALATMAHYTLIKYASKPGFSKLSEGLIKDVVKSAGLLQIESVPSKSTGAAEEDEEEDEAKDT